MAQIGVVSSEASTSAPFLAQMSLQSPEVDRFGLPDNSLDLRLTASANGTLQAPTSSLSGICLVFDNQDTTNTTATIDIVAVDSLGDPKPFDWQAQKISDPSVQFSLTFLIDTDAEMLARIESSALSRDLGQVSSPGNVIRAGLVSFGPSPEMPSFFMRQAPIGALS